MTNSTVFSTDQLKAEIEKEKRLIEDLKRDRAFNLKYEIAQEKQKIAELRAKKDESPLEYAGHVGAMGAKSVADNVAFMGDLLTSPKQTYNHLFHEEEKPFISRNLDKATKALVGDLAEPRTPGERVFSSTVGAVGPMGIFKKSADALKAGAALAKATPEAANVLGKIVNAGRQAVGKVAQGAGSFVGAGNKLTTANVAGNAAVAGGIQQLIENGYEPGEAMAMVLGASMFAPKVVKGAIDPKISAKNLVKEPLKKGMDKEALKAFKDAGIQPTAGEVFPGLRKPQQVFHAIFPGPGNKVFNNRSEEVKKALGMPESMPSFHEMGEDILEAANARKVRRKTKAKEFFDAVPIDPKAGVSPRKSLDFLTNEFANQYTASDKKKFLSTPGGVAFQKLLDDLREKKGLIPYASMRKHATDLYEQSRGQLGQISNSQEGLLKNTANLLREDINDYVKDLGGDAWKAQKRANKYYKDYMDEKQVLNSITKVDNSNNLLESVDAAKGLLSDVKGGRTDRLKLIQNEEKRLGDKKIGSSILSALGRAKNDTQGDVLESFMSPSQLYSSIKGLQPETVDLLVKSIPSKDGKQKLRDVLTAVRASRGLAAEANHPHTASHGFFYNMIDKLSKSPGIKAGAAGVAGSAATAMRAIPEVATTLAVLYGGARVMSSPKTINLLHNVLKSNPKTNLSMALNKMAKSDNPGIAKVGVIARKVYLDNLKETQKHGALKKTISRGLQAQNRATEEKK